GAGIAVRNINHHLGVVRQFNEETITTSGSGGDHVNFQESRGGVKGTGGGQQTCRHQREKSEVFFHKWVGLIATPMPQCFDLWGNEPFFLAEAKPCFYTPNLRCYHPL